MKLKPNAWTAVATIPANLSDPTAILAINDGKLYVTYDVDDEPAEEWVWTPVSLKVEDL